MLPVTTSAEARDGAVSPPAREKLWVEQSRPAWSRADLIVGAAIVSAFVAARLWNVASYRLWFDEIYSVQAIHRGWLDLVRFIRDYDPHPPGWYLLFKAWAGVAGESYFSLGLLPAIFGIATVVPLFLLARELRLRPLAVNLALALLAVNGYLLGNAQELRMYTLLAFLTTCSAWLFVRYCNADGPAPRELAALTFVNLLTVSTQYYGWLPIGAQGVFLLWWNWRKALRYAAATAAVVVALLPWIYLVAHAAQRRVAVGQEAIAFTERPTMFSVALFYSVLSGAIDFPRSTTIACVVFLVPVMLWIVSAWRRRAVAGASSRSVSALLAVLAIFPVAVAAVTSLVLPFSVWGQRHLITAAVPYALLVGAALEQLRPRLLRTAWISAVVVWLAFASVQALRTPYKVPAWDALVARMAASVAPDGSAPIPVYALNSSAAYNVQFYLDRARSDRFRAVIVRKASPRNRDLFGPFSVAPKPYWALDIPVVLLNRLNDIPADRFWVADDGGDDGEAASAWGDDRSARALLTAAGFAVGDPLTATVVIRRSSARRVELFPAWRAGLAQLPSNR